MQWQSWADFWHMGGNAAFVWGSYGVWIALAAWELWQLRQQRSSTLRQLRRWHRATQGQAGRRNDAVDNSPTPRSHA